MSHYPLSLLLPGGLVKDWFLSLSRRFMDGRLGLLARLPEPNASTYTIEERALHLHSNALQYMRFFGRFLAKALLDRQSVDVCLDRTILLHLLDKPVTVKDLKHSDPLFCKD